jgi:hypothetical protein
LHGVAASARRISRQPRYDLRPAFSPAHLDAALDRFAQSVPQIKKNVLTACAETVAFDSLIQPREAEILRAIADTLDCPIPPFLQA